MRLTAKLNDVSVGPHWIAEQSLIFVRANGSKWSDAGNRLFEKLTLEPKKLIISPEDFNWPHTNTSHWRQFPVVMVMSDS